MKTSNRLVIAATAMIGIMSVTTPAWSGSTQQHRWEGVAIGIGAALVGSALINHHHAPVTVTHVYRYQGHHRHDRHHPGAWQRRHWGGYGYGYHHRSGSWSGKWHPGRERHDYRPDHRSHNPHRHSYDRHGSRHRGQDFRGRSGHDRGRGHR